MISYITRMVGPISRRQQFPGREMYAIQLQILDTCPMHARAVECMR